MPKKKGAKVQGRAKQKVKAQNGPAGGKPAWMKKFAKSFDDGPLLPQSHANLALSTFTPIRAQDHLLNMFLHRLR
jgi:hypothetical protein